LSEIFVVGRKWTRQTADSISTGDIPYFSVTNQVAISVNKV